MPLGKRNEWWGTWKLKNGQHLGVIHSTNDEFNRRFDPVRTKAYTKVNFARQIMKRRSTFNRSFWRHQRPWTSTTRKLRPGRSAAYLKKRSTMLKRRTTTKASLSSRFRRGAKSLRMMQKARQRVFLPKKVASDVQSELQCLRIRRNLSVTVNPNTVDSTYLQVPISTLNLEQTEWEAFRQQIVGRFQRFRFCGASQTIVRTGDKSMLAALNAAAPGAVQSVSLLNNRDSRAMMCNDAYQNLTSVSATPMGMERCNNVKKLWSYKPLKATHFKVPDYLKNNVWKGVTNQTFPTDGSIAPYLVNTSLRGIIDWMYVARLPGTTNATYVNIPNANLVRFDQFPQIPVPNLGSPPGSTVQPQTEFNLSVYTNFYFECAAKDVNGEVSSL
uniref:Capsid protein n=1 Tax=Cressdnaviricota sp. TaxID=2748378 RepID=A0A6M3YQ17_9VIRU|nr:MAG: capsid protein [Cressdnaviricota sp.]